MTLKVLDMHRSFYSFIHSSSFHELGFLYIIAFERELSIELHVLDIVSYYPFKPFSLSVQFIEQVPFI
jgi:hypothetical protein